MDHPHLPDVPGRPNPYHPRPVVAPTSGMATAALVFGIIGFLGGWCLFGIPCLIAIGCGHLGMSETKNGTKAGRGSAVAGLILGYVCVVPMALIAIWLFLGATADS